MTKHFMTLRERERVKERKRERESIDCKKKNAINSIFNRCHSKKKRKYIEKIIQIHTDLHAQNIHIFLCLIEVESIHRKYTCMYMCVCMYCTCISVCVCVCVYVCMYVWLNRNFFFLSGNWKSL